MKDTVKIKALENKNGHMEPGMIYEVSKDSADFLISMGRAVAAKGSEKVGKVYDTTKNTGGKKTGGKKPDDIID